MSPAKVQPTATNADSMEELDEKSYVGVGRVSIIYDLDDNIMEYGAKGKGRFSCAWFKDMLPLATIAGLSTVAIYVPTIIYDSDAWLVTDTVVRGTALSHILMIPPSVIMLMWCVSAVTGNVSAVAKQRRSVSALFLPHPASATGSRQASSKLLRMCNVLPGCLSPTCD